MVLRTASSVLLLGLPLAAQTDLPILRATAAVSTVTGGLLSVTTTGVPGRTFAVLADTSPGPIRVFGTEIALGLSSATLTLAAGALPALGDRTVALPVPAAATSLNGLTLFTQALELDFGAPNGLFRASNGESTVFHAGRTAIVDRFDTPAADGFTGNYDATTNRRLRGGDVRVRTHRTVDLSQGVTFGSGIATPLGHDGVRAQMVYRPQDVGATGEEELVTAVRWRLFGSQLSSDSFAQFEMQIGHTTVLPDYSVETFSALPAFPQSGLDPAFAQNYLPTQAPLTVYTGPYTIGPASLRSDGYVDYPSPLWLFPYNGVDSLLLEFRIPPSAVPMQNANGQIVRLMVLSSPLPGARNVAFGTPTAPIDPTTVTRGRADNAMHDYQIEFTRIKTTATSPWRAGAPGADYQQPILAATTPVGTSISVDYRGADDATGSNPTAWAANVDIADGRAFVQYRFVFVADRRSGAVPSVDTLVIPH